MKKYLKYCLISLVLCSCAKSEEMDGREYLSWVNNTDNGLKLTKELRGITYSVQYKPYDFIILKEEKKYNVSKSSLEYRTKELDGMVYYDIRISTLDKTDVLAKGIQQDKSLYIQRVNYFSYDFQNNISLITETDSVTCGLYHFVQGYGITPYVDMVVGFPVQKINESQTLVIDDQVFGNGIIKFFIDKQNIKNIPHLATT